MEPPIRLKNLPRDQVSELLPENLILLGDLHVERADAEQLLSIKRGDWSIERVRDEADRLFKLAEEAYVRSSLPAKPDTEKAEKLCIEIIARYHALRDDSKLTTL